MNINSTYTANAQIDGFGTFNSDYQRNDGTNGITSPVVFTLTSQVDSFTKNDHSAIFAVHLAFTDCSGFVSDGTTTSTTSTDVCGTTKVPEPGVLFFMGVALVAVGIWGRKYLLNSN
jgi:hypothetical protein